MIGLPLSFGFLGRDAASILASPAAPVKADSRCRPAVPRHMKKREKLTPGR
jgi:hypothetical protein